MNFPGFKNSRISMQFVTAVSFTALSFQTAATYLKSETNLLTSNDSPMSFPNMVQFSPLNSDRKCWEAGKKVAVGCKQRINRKVAIIWNQNKVISSLPNLCTGISGTPLQYVIVIVDCLGAIFYGTRFIWQQCTIRQYQALGFIWSICSGNLGWD